MNKSYLIVPAALLLVFGFIYRTASAEMERADQAKAQVALTAKAADDERRKALDLKAEADARTRQEERDRADKERETKRMADYTEAMRRLTEERDLYATDGAKFSAEVASLDTELTQLRTKKEAASREVFDLTREVELPKIERQNAELEIQRTHAMVASRVAASALAAITPPPAPAAK